MRCLLLIRVAVISLEGFLWCFWGRYSSWWRHDARSFSDRTDFKLFIEFNRHTCSKSWDLSFLRALNEFGKIQALAVVFGRRLVQQDFCQLSLISVISFIVQQHYLLNTTAFFFKGIQHADGLCADSSTENARGVFSSLPSPPFLIVWDGLSVLYFNLKWICLSTGLAGTLRNFWLNRHLIRGFHYVVSVAWPLSGVGILLFLTQ